MKKFILLLALFLGLNSVLAIDVNPAYPRCYQITDNFEVVFNPVDEYAQKSFTREEKKLYKKIEKNEKYIDKGKVTKAEKFYPELIPNQVRIINYYTGKGDYKKALEYAQKLAERQDFTPKYALDYKLGCLYSLNGDYQTSNKILTPYTNFYNPINEGAIFQLGQNWFFMQDFNKAVEYLTKVTASSVYYLSSQEVLYTCYSLMKENGKAYTVAKNLIKSIPDDPNNHMRLAYVTSNRQEKLNNYYTAKFLFSAQNASYMITKINELVAPLEQQKIDEAYKKISVYCKKPDWTKIKKRNQNMLQDDVNYWDERQSEFFESANECIKKYSGNNLAACFQDLNETQLNLDRDLAQEVARLEEAKQREAQIRLLQQQNALINEQNMLQWSRYNRYYYPSFGYGYYHRPYWW